MDWFVWFELEKMSMCCCVVCEYVERVFGDVCDYVECVENGL